MNLHNQDIIRIAKREGHAEGHATGLKEGEQQKAIEDAKALLADGFVVKKYVSFIFLDFFSVFLSEIEFHGHIIYRDYINHHN